MTEHVLTVVATDVFGETTQETLLVEYDPAVPFVKLRPREGKTLLVDAGDLKAVLES